MGAREYSVGQSHDRVGGGRLPSISLRTVTTGAAVAAYVAAWALSPLVTNSTLSDLDIFFWPAAQSAVHGHPFQVYSLPSLGSYPNANGPLSLMPLIPAAALADALGAPNNVALRAGFAGLLTALFALLLAQQATHLIRRARGQIEWRLAAPLVVLAAPALWIGVADFGHIEQPLELWLVLLGLRFALGRRYLLTAIMLGLAVLTRTTALLYIIPFALAPLVMHRVRPAMSVLAGAVITAGVGIAPFLVADPGGVIHSLITYRGALRIAGGSVWLVAVNTPIAAAVQHGDVFIVVGAATALCAWVVWRRPDAASEPAGLAGLLTVVAVCFPMLAKTSLPYYVLESYVFAAVWWLARPGSAWNWRIVVPLLLTADVFLGKWAESLPAAGTPFVQEGIISSAILALVATLVLAEFLLGRAGRTSSAAEPGRTRAKPVHAS